MKSLLLLVLLTVLLITLRCSTPDAADAQSIQLGEALMLARPSLAEDADGDAYAAYLRDEVMPAWNGRHPALPLHAFRADRGEQTGDFLLAWSGSREGLNGASEVLSPDALAEAGVTAEGGATDLRDPGAITEYELVGAETARPLPDVELLGIHRIQVIPEWVTAFDAFVRDTLYTTFADRAPGMRLLYYKDVDRVGEYILIFTFDTVERREEYFPTGQPETEALTEAFRPMSDVGDGLMRYQVEGTYLDRSSGLAAAVFESTDWTDYVHIRAR